jgi:hypothetical protein
LRHFLDTSQAPFTNLLHQRLLRFHLDNRLASAGLSLIHRSNSAEATWHGKFSLSIAGIAGVRTALSLQLRSLQRVLRITYTNDRGGTMQTNAALFTEYLEILNREGPSSTQAAAFCAYHRHNAGLMALIPRQDIAKHQLDSSIREQALRD